ncbi:MAG TPA: rhodanese-like domain-containing protein [Dermatophilaceae bacterium]|jgi:phage shock protein E
MRMHTSRSWSRLLSAAALAIAAVTGISACTSSSPAASSSETATGVHMSATEFSTAMKAPGTVVLDVRTPAEFAAGHLPEAKNIDIEGPDFASGIAALDKTATYAVYCRSGNRSATAMEQMTAASFTHVYDLAGGIGAWQNMGGPMTMGAP